MAAGLIRSLRLRRWVVKMQARGYIDIWFCASRSVWSIDRTHSASYVSFLKSGLDYFDG